MRWGNTNYAKGTKKETIEMRQKTGIYGSNSSGEVILTIYCFNSSAENSENFQGLPKVCGDYCCPTTTTYESSVAVRKSGYKDEYLMQQLI